MTPSVRDVELLRVEQTSARRVGDRVVAEEPLQIRLGGAPLVVTMRTPGRDRDLVAGFLLSEGIVRHADDITAIRHCTHPDAEPGTEHDLARPGNLDSGPETRDQRPKTSAVARTAERDNTVDVWLSPEASDRADARLAERRLAPVASSCGVCGRRTIDDLMHVTLRPAGQWSVARDAVLAWPTRLRQSQAAFDETGGLHAAALFDPDGPVVGIAEDVGRHNAVDKVIGAELLAERFPLGNRVLFVSGRTSFEIVQKAIVAGVPLVASVSAPSSLAVDLAREAGVTLLGFVRDGSFNVYTGAERIRV